jgi:hypothetical protein
LASKGKYKRSTHGETDPSTPDTQHFYDTDGIQESQSEQIQICSDCAGALRIDSASDRGRHILAVQIPRKACSKCKEIGYRWYDTADTDPFDMIFLQDRTEDAYLEKRIE